MRPVAFILIALAVLFIGRSCIRTDLYNQVKGPPMNPIFRDMLSDPLLIGCIFGVSVILAAGVVVWMMIGVLKRGSKT